MHIQYVAQVADIATAVHTSLGPTATKSSWATASNTWMSHFEDLNLLAGVAKVIRDTTTSHRAQRWQETALNAFTTESASRLGR